MTASAAAVASRTRPDRAARRRGRHHPAQPAEGDQCGDAGDVSRHRQGARRSSRPIRRSALILLEGAGERGLCAGGDIRALYESSKVNGDLGKILWREEYILNARIAKFPKPYVAFMDGIVMGGGVGLSAHGRHRVVTEKTKLAMPEVGLGFFPDVGGTWLLSRSPGEIGTYFGLTGQTMNGPDAIYARFADAVVPSGKLAALREALINLRAGASPPRCKPLIDGFATGETSGPVAAMQPQIDRWFAHDRMEDIVAALQRDGSELAQSTLKTLNEKSPRGMVVTLKLLRLARGVVLAGGMPGAGISRRARSVQPATIFARACAPR